MGSRRKSALWAWVVAALAYGVSAACVIEPTVTGGPCKQDSDCTDDGIPCTREICNIADGFCDRKPQDLPFGDTRCDDKNPCTSELCSAGKCAYMPQELPFGDMGCDDGNQCTDEACDNGACAHLPSTSAPSDGNECTTDTCVDGVATYTPVMDSTACGLGDMLVCTGGKCACTSAAQCGVSTACLVYECLNSSCTSTIKAQGTLVDGKDPGDCLKNVCDGANAVVTVPDQTDPPTDPTAGNCKTKACDAQGTVIDLDDPTDMPADDSNVCTTEGCNGGTPNLYTPVADGTACGGMAKCDVAAGGGYETVPANVCVGGACTTPATVPCGFYQCNATNDGCLGACNSGTDCIQGAVCDNVGNACKPAVGTGKPCATGAECGSGFCIDGLCCNTQCNGLCQRCNDALSKGFCIATTLGLDPDNECPGNDSCNGLGACAKPQGAGCAANLDCLSGVCEDAACCDVVCGGPCMRCDLAGTIGTCGPVAINVQATGCTGTQVCDGNGGCKTKGGQSCGANPECLSGFCQDGVCCNNACAGTCARCDLAGSVGTCINVGSGQQIAGCNGVNACDGVNNCKKIDGQTCTAASQCVSGFCPDEDPVTGGIQGICCNEACTAECKSCAGGKTVGGVSGICDLIITKTDPDNECAGACMNNGTGCCVFDGISMNMCK